MTEKLHETLTSGVMNAGFPDFAFAEQFTEIKLLERRKIFLSEAVTAKVAKRIVGELLALDTDKPGEPITLYINSPGGEVNSGFAIFDMIRFIKSPVTIVNAGLCAS